MTVRLVPEARLELRDAADYYEPQQVGLGYRFWQEVDEHLLWISRNPEIPRQRPGGYRRVNLRVFPYYLAYIIRGDVLWLLAIAHSRRKPEYWIQRSAKT